MERLRGADSWPGWHIMKQEGDTVVVLGLCVPFVGILEIVEIISNNICKTYSTNSQNKIFLKQVEVTSNISFNAINQGVSISFRERDCLYSPPVDSHQV